MVIHITRILIQTTMINILLTRIQLCEAILALQYRNSVLNDGVTHHVVTSLTVLYNSCNEQILRSVYNLMNFLFIHI